MIRKWPRCEMESQHCVRAAVERYTPEHMSRFCTDWFAIVPLFLLLLMWLLRANPICVRCPSDWMWWTRMAEFVGCWITLCPYMCDGRCDGSHGIEHHTRVEWWIIHPESNHRNNDNVKCICDLFFVARFVDLWCDRYAIGSFWWVLARSIRIISTETEKNTAASLQLWESIRFQLAWLWKCVGGFPNVVTRYFCLLIFSSLSSVCWISCNKTNTLELRTGGILEWIKRVVFLRSPTGFRSSNERCRM